MEDLISVIIPCYNAEKTMTRTINSVREQDYKNLEIIIVNDGSKDNTLNIANEFAKLDSRIHVINQKNSGVSVARNNGIKYAHGDYIMFLDADDNYLTNKAYTNMLNKLKEENADVCVCNFTHPCFEQHLKSGVYDLTDEYQFMTYYQDFFAFAMPWNKLFKRECITEDYAVGIKFAEDELFNLDNLKNIKKAVVIDEVYHNYYCAPYNPNEPASAVNSIYSEDKFWEKKHTIWHLGNNNNQHRLDSINKFYKKFGKDLFYPRIFDFFFWDFMLMAKNCVLEEHISNVCKGIFNEELFIEAIKYKEKFGLILKDYSLEDIETFVKLAYHAFKEIKQSNIKMSVYKVLLSIFAKIFYRLPNQVDSKDILARTYVELINNSTPEAVYANSLLELMGLAKEQKNKNLIFLDETISKCFEGLNEFFEHKTV